jgi:hypothetical protein
MDEEAEEFSLLDLIDYYEGGPVIKGKTPDVNRVLFGPGENTYSNKPVLASGKNSTTGDRLAELHKEALGLFDVPGGSPPGAQGWRSRAEGFKAEDSETSNLAGGTDDANEEEAWPAVNIDRKKDETQDDEEWNFFDFLMSSSGYNDFESVKKGFYIADKGRVWMKKSTGSIYYSKFDNSNNILLINTKEGLSKSQKTMLKNKVNMDNSISNRKKEAYREILSN